MEARALVSDRSARERRDGIVPKAQPRLVAVGGQDDREFRTQTRLLCQQIVERSHARIRNQQPRLTIIEDIGRFIRRQLGGDRCDIEAGTLRRPVNLEIAQCIGQPNGDRVARADAKRAEIMGALVADRFQRAIGQRFAGFGQYGSRSGRFGGGVKARMHHGSSK